MNADQINPTGALVTLGIIAMLFLPGVVGAQDQELCDYAMEGETEEVQRLLGQGADPNCTDPDGESALMFAASSMVPEVVRALLDAGANPNLQNTYGQTALMSAIISDAGLDDEEGHVVYSGIAKMLIEAGADVGLRDEDGKTALDHARDYRLVQMVEVLEGG